MKSTAFMAAALGAMIAFTACKKEKNVLPGNSDDPVATTNGSNTKRHVPQANLGNNTTDVPDLIKAFKQSMTKGTAATARMVDKPVELGYAASLLEATLNYDHDGFFDKNYEISGEKITMSIALEEGELVSNDALEDVYSQLRQFIEENTGGDKKLLLINIESYTDGNIGIFEVEAQFFVLSSPGCDLPANWYRYAVSGITRRSGSTDPVNTCNVMWQDNNPSIPATYNDPGMPNINSAVMCRFRNNFACSLTGPAGSTYYWFPIGPSLNLYGNPTNTTDPMLYSSGYHPLTWFCGNGGYLNAATANNYKTNLTNAVLAHLANLGTGAWEVSSTQIIDQGAYINWPTPATRQKAIFWDFKAQFGIRNCYVIHN